MATTIQSGRANSPLLTADVASRAEVFGGRGLNFDGITDYLDSGSQESTWKNVSALSITAWIYIDAHKTHNGLIGKHQSDNESTGIMTTASSFKFYISSGGENRGSCTPPSAGAWHHIACVFNGSGTGNSGRMQIYFNGSLQSLSFTGTIPTTTSNDSTYGTNSVTIGDYQGGNKFNGKISDLKIYSSALTEAEVQSQYLKPESVPSPSTLVAWYPMSEANPDSPQSIVYDHSEKKLGSELNTVANATSPTNETNATTGWAGASATVSSVAEGYTSDYSLKVVTSVSEGYAYSSGWTVDNDSIYKLSITWKTEGTETNEWRYGWGTSSGSGTYGTVALNGLTDWSTSVQYINTTSTSLHLFLQEQSSTSNALALYVDSISIKKVLMGNHATTNFFGDELFDADASTVDSGTHSWVEYAGATMTNDSGAIKVVCSTSNGNGAYLKFADALDLNDDLTVGATYRFSCSVKVDTGDVRLNMSNATGFSYHDVTETSFTTKTMDFVAGHATDTFVYVHRGQNSTIWLDNFSLKEVGISSTGFTTAQNEPTIPQIPLVRYNEKMLFDGIDDKVDLTTSSPRLGTSDFSISFWLCTLTTLADVRLFGSDNSSTTQWSVHGEGTTRLRWNSGLTAISSHLPNSTFNDGKLRHIVISADRSGNLIYYVDGVLLSSHNISSDSAVDLKSIRYIGTYGAGTSSFAQMDILDDFSLWNCALTQTEIQELFNDGLSYDATTHSKSANLIGYWRNDGVITWKDRSTNSNHGTVAGSPDSITIREGLNSNKDGLGFPFTNPTSNIVRFSRNGLAEHLSIPTTKGLDVQEAFTVECWFKQPDMGSGYQHLINRDDATNRNWLIMSTNGAITVGLFSGGSYSSTQTSGAYDDDNWHHLCAVVTTGTSVQIYIDTVLAKLNTTSIPTTIDNDPSVFQIGNRSGTDQFFIGSIDEVRFYNKALTAFEADGSAPEEGETAVSGEVVKNYKHGKGKHKND